MTIQTQRWMHDSFCHQPSLHLRAQTVKDVSSHHHSVNDVTKFLSNIKELAWQLKSDRAQERHSVGRGQGW